MKLLGVCGSLRRASANRNLLHACGRYLVARGENVSFSLFDDLANLPAFNPDEDDRSAPHPAVATWRAALREAEGILFSAPEYAHGLPGILKNALDWIVASGELSQKRVCVLSVSSSGDGRAHAQLCEVIRTMDAVLWKGPHFKTAQLANQNTNPAPSVFDTVLSPLLVPVLTALLGQPSEESSGTEIISV